MLALGASRLVAHVYAGILHVQVVWARSQGVVMVILCSFCSEKCGVVFVMPRHVFFFCGRLVLWTTKDLM